MASSASPAAPAAGALIPQYFAGRSVFITGATGFMGKVLVARLLATCPGIARLHLLARPRRGVAAEKRLSLLKSSQVFDVIRDRCPHQLEKLHIVPGDTAQPGLGISSEALQELQEVSVVFHSAATVRFNEPLERAVDENVRSVLELLHVADQLPKLDVLVHVSTAYCNAELPRVAERVYPPRVPLAQLLSLVQLPPDVLAQITPQLIAPKANTYTFTKAMAETALADRKSRHFPVAIVRPSIVVDSERHPLPGWSDSAAGPAGAAVGCGKGVLRAFRLRSAARADLLPVDIACDAIIGAAWETATDRPQEVKVYNCSSYENPTTWAQFRDSMLRYTRQHPFDSALWYPFVCTVENNALRSTLNQSIGTNESFRSAIPQAETVLSTGRSLVWDSKEPRMLFKVLQVVLQTAPLYGLEYVNKLRGVKSYPSPIAISERLRAMNKALAFFALREWRFDTDNVRALRQRLTPEDASIYNIDINTVRWEQHYCNYVKGARKYLLREKDENIPEAKKNMDRRTVLGANSPIPRISKLLNNFSDLDINLESLAQMRSKVLGQLGPQNRN